MTETRQLVLRSVLALCVCGVALSPDRASGQDSVAATPGGNDALSAQGEQRVRYAIEMSPILSSWSLEWRVAPILKSSRSVDPLFNTNLAGAVAASSDLIQGVSVEPTEYATWEGPGFGVNDSENTSPQSVTRATFSWQFGAALNDFDLTGTNIISAIVRQRIGEPNRLFVERVVAASSRETPAGEETSTLSLGAIDASGATLIRGDAFNVDSGPLASLRLDNIIRVDAAARDESIVNTFTAVLGTNVASDEDATKFCLSKQSITLNTPAVQPASTTADGEPNMLTLAFDGTFRGGAQTATTAHLNTGVSASRGNCSYSTLTPVAGAGGTAACLGVTNSSGSTQPDALNAWGLSQSAAVSSQPISATLPATVSEGDFVANESVFHQWRSQISFRGGNGPVGIGQTPAGDPLLAGAALSDSGDEFIALADFTGGSPIWTAVAFPDKPVLDGPAGAQIGRLVRGETLTPPLPTSLSAPAVDRFGNVYFVSAWKPNLGPAGTGLFRAVRTPTGYDLELLLRSGQIVIGASSQTPYEIVRLIVADSDSAASGGFWSGSLLQTPVANDPGSMSPLAVGGLLVNAVIRYDNAAQEEIYDATLFVQGRLGGLGGADIDGDGVVGPSDLALLLGRWDSDDPSTDLNGDGVVGAADLAMLLGAWGPVN